MGNKNLIKAAINKRDEFYTRLEDIENEVKHYTKHFEGKTVYLNCDDPRESNFFKYFLDNFERLGLKRLISSCYKNQDYNLFNFFELENREKAFWVDYNGEKECGKTPTVETIGINYFKGDGDFRSKESIKLLKQSDIVVTNPPFSLFSEYITQLIEHDKKFLIIGNQNAITYKEIFPLIKENKLWLGVGFKGGATHFINKEYENYATSSDQKEGMIRVSGVVWYTNLEINKRNQELTLHKTYTPEEYPKYDNCNVINVDKVVEIPKDYKGVMGVPITFIEKYNPSQFEIVGKIDSGKIDEYNIGSPVIKGVTIYKRIAIRNKTLNSWL